MITNQDQKDSSRYTFGIKSKFGERILNHPWLSITILIFVTGCVTFVIDKNLDKLLWSLQIVSPVLFSITAIARFIHRNFCYRVVIDREHETISFYLMFNQGIFEAKINDIKVILDRHFNCMVNERKFVIQDNLLHSVVGLLPESTEIKFVGFFGRHWKKELIRTKGLPKGGQGLS